MLNNDDIRGAGFTIIADDSVADDRDQESINAMFDDLRKVLNAHGFDISIVASNEDAMKFQGKILFREMFEKIIEMI